MTLARLLIVGLLALPGLPAHADTTAQTIVHMLDYVGVDYPEFVKDGKVLDEAEYREQQEFSAQVIALLGKLKYRSSFAQRFSVCAASGCPLVESAPVASGWRFKFAMRASIAFLTSKTWLMRPRPASAPA